MTKHYKKLSGGWWIVGGIIAAVAVLFLVGHFQNASGKTNRDIALSCTTDLLTKFHIHPNLQILVNGQSQTIPANIGISFICMHPIHTHDMSGKIHIESPEQRDFTLADFFAVWGKTFNQGQILDYKIDDQHVIKETVNGTQVQTFEDTILRDGDQIVISYETK